MSKKFIICAVLVVFAISLNVALSAMDYPQDLKKAVAPYPKAKIVRTVNVTGTVMVIMEVGAKPDTVFEFYKKELTANGWTILTEVKQQGHTTLIGEKGSNNIAVDIGLDQFSTAQRRLCGAPNRFGTQNGIVPGVGGKGHLVMNCLRDRFIVALGGPGQSYAR